MHLDDVPAPGACVEQVDVLRDDRAHEPAALELRERAMRIVRLGSGQHVDPLRVEAPDLLRVLAEGAERRVLHRVDLGPDPGRRAEVRDAALGRHAGAGEDDARLAGRDQLGKACRRHAAMLGRSQEQRPRSEARPLLSPLFQSLRCYARSDGLQVRQRGDRPLRGDRRAGHRAPRRLPRLVRDDEDRVPAPVPGRLPRAAQGGHRRADARGVRALHRRGAVRRPAHGPGTVQRRPRRPLPVRLRGRARRGSGRRRLDDARLRLRRRPPPTRVPAWLAEAIAEAES